MVRTVSPDRVLPSNGYVPAGAKIRATPEGRSIDPSLSRQDVKASTSAMSDSIESGTFAKQQKAERFITVAPKPPETRVDPSSVRSGARVPLRSQNESALQLLDPLTYRPHPIVSRPQSVEKARAAGQSSYERAWGAVGHASNAIFGVIGDAVAAAVNGVGYLASGAIFALQSPALLFGARSDALWKRARHVTIPIFGALSGVAQGVVRIPQGALSLGLGFCKNLLSLQWTRSPSAAVAMVVHPVVAAVMTLSAPLLYGVKGLSDAMTPPTPLTPEERATMAPYFSDELLSRERIVPGGSLLDKIGISNMAFTIGDNVYCTYPRLQEGFMGHEFTHSLQYREALGGDIGFLSSYVADFLGNLFTNRFDAESASASLRDERDAYAIGPVMGRIDLNRLLYQSDRTPRPVASLAARDITDLGSRGRLKYADVDERLTMILVLANVDDRNWSDDRYNQASCLAVMLETDLSPADQRFLAGRLCKYEYASGISYAQRILDKLNNNNNGWNTDDVVSQLKQALARDSR